MSEELKVVFFTDACQQHQRTLFGLNTVCIRKTWECSKCKETKWKIERPQIATL